MEEKSYCILLKKIVFVQEIRKDKIKEGSECKLWMEEKCSSGMKDKRRQKGKKG